MICKVKRLDERAIIPTKAYGGDSGWDIYAVSREDILPMQTRRIPLGIAIGFPPGVGGQLRPRSSQSLKGVLVHTGTIDQKFIGELCVTITNLSHCDVYRIFSGDRICQLVLEHVLETTMAEADELQDTQRGQLGHGSSGK